MRTIALIQARLSSSRLPGKVLMDIEGVPMLAHVVERVSAARLLDGVAVATSTDSTDDRLAAYCRANGIRHHRGPLDDVLARFVQAGKREEADVIVRVTADCPLIDPALIDAVVTMRDAHRADYASNVLSRRYPRGLDVEVFTAEALARADREGKAPHHREHVTPYLYEEPGRFQVVGLDCERDLSAHRWTVDTAADLDVVRAIQQRLDNPLAGWREVLAVVEREPNLARRNAHIKQKPTRAA
ncbi:cytidylyltransferase domain-containing protein [Desertibaculum subflavum]|uniref:cytidylyltransferase domain-containing protein n=1 Tax=Desertibaculum subflavum TaxID=2268458 RepID=UPI000E663296